MNSGRAVVTGGAGFVGSHLCDRLLAQGWVVVCVDSLLTGERDNLASASTIDRFSFLEADVTRELDVDGDVDWVLHLASPASPRDYQEHPIATLRVGALGSLNGLELARKKGAGFPPRPEAGTCSTSPLDCSPFREYIAANFIDRMQF